MARKKQSRKSGSKKKSAPRRRSKQQQSSSVKKNPLSRYNRLLGLRLEQEQREHADLLRTLEREIRNVKTKKGKQELKQLVSELKRTSPTKQTVRTSEEMKRIMRDLKTKSNAATGRKARALEELGLRDRSWTMAVGDSPKAPGK